MATVKLEAFARELAVLTEGPVTGDEHRLAFARYAKQVCDEEIALQEARSGVRPVVETRVDGELGAALETVRLGGQIRFDFKYLTEMVLFALEVLRGLAPVGSGRYRSRFFVLADGVEVDPQAIPAHARGVFITNDRPYARKIQVGATGFRAYSGLFDVANKAVRSHYGNIVKTDVKFIKLSGAYQRQKPPSKGQVMTYPALAFYLHG